MTVFNLFKSVNFSLSTHLRNYCFFNAMNIIKQLIAGTVEGVDGFLAGACPVFLEDPNSGIKRKLRNDQNLHLPS